MYMYMYQHTCICTSAFLHVGNSCNENKAVRQNQFKLASSAGIGLVVYGACSSVHVNSKLKILRHLVKIKLENNYTNRLLNSELEMVWNDTRLNI